jgi:hypothetical protein
VRKTEGGDEEAEGDWGVGEERRVCSWERWEACAESCWR